MSLHAIDPSYIKTCLNNKRLSKTSAHATRPILQQSAQDGLHSMLIYFRTQQYRYYIQIKKNISATYAVHWSENTHIYAAKTQSALLHPQMSFLCLILSRSFVESTYCSATTKTYPFRKNDAIALIESIEVFVATCPRSVRTKRSRHFRRYLFLRFYSLIYSRSLQSHYL